MRQQKVQFIIDLTETPIFLPAGDVVGHWAESVIGAPPFLLFSSTLWLVLGLQAVSRL